MQPTIVFVGIGGLMVILALPLLFRWIPRNPLYGLRVPATYKDEWVWYEANARSGRDLIVVGITVILFALGLRVLPISHSSYGATIAVITLVEVLIFAVVGWIRANRLLKERRNS